MSTPSDKQQQMLLFAAGSAKEPVLVSACFLGIPCRWHGRRAKKMPTPRTSETLPLGKTGADVLDNGLRLIAPETGQDVTDFHIRGGEYALEIAQIVGANRAYLKSGSPSCDKDGIVGEILRRSGVHVIRVG